MNTAKAKVAWMAQVGSRSRTSSRAHKHPAKSRAVQVTRNAQRFTCQSQRIMTWLATDNVTNFRSAKWNPQKEAKFGHTRTARPDTCLRTIQRWTSTRRSSRIATWMQADLASTRGRSSWAVWTTTCTSTSTFPRWEAERATRLTTSASSSRRTRKRA